MKKLLTTTAIIGLVASSVSSFAETKIAGSIEQTINMSEIGGTGTGSDTGMGQETNLKISSKKELDNGLTLSGHFQSEDGAIDSTSIKLTSGGTFFEIGADTGQHIHSNINPRTGDDINQFIKVSGTDGFNAYQVHDKQHVSLGSKIGDAGTVVVSYAPGSNGIEASDGASSSTGGSGTEISFVGSLGVDGLKVLVGQESISAENSGAADTKEKVVGFSYGQGAWALGGTHRSFDDDDATLNSVDTVQSISASYAISDDVSVSIQKNTAEFESSAKTDEDSMLYSIGYNLGGLGIDLSYGVVDNLAGASTAAADVEEVQIRTVYKF